MARRFDPSTQFLEEGDGLNTGKSPNPFEELETSDADTSASVASIARDPLGVTVHDPGKISKFDNTLDCTITCSRSEQGGMIYECHISAGKDYPNPEYAESLAAKLRSILAQNREEIVRSCLFGHESFRGSASKRIMTRDTVAACDVAGLVRYHYEKAHPESTRTKMCTFRGLGDAIGPKTTLPSNSPTIVDSEAPEQARLVSQLPKQRSAVEGYRQRLNEADCLHGTVPCPISWCCRETSVDLIKAGREYGNEVQMGTTEEDDGGTKVATSSASIPGYNSRPQRKQRARKERRSIIRQEAWRAASLSAVQGLSQMNSWTHLNLHLPEEADGSGRDATATVGQPHSTHSQSRANRSILSDLLGDTNFATHGTSSIRQPHPIDTPKPSGFQHLHPNSAAQSYGYTSRSRSPRAGSAVLDELFPALGDSPEYVSGGHADVARQGTQSPGQVIAEVNEWDREMEGWNMKVDEQMSGVEGSTDLGFTSDSGVRVYGMSQIQNSNLGPGVYGQHSLEQQDFSYGNIPTITSYDDPYLVGTQPANSNFDLGDQSIIPATLLLNPSTQDTQVFSPVNEDDANTQDPSGWELDPTDFFNEADS